MSDLRKAAQALVERWDTPLWKDAPHTGQYIDDLRAALAQPEQKPLWEQWKCMNEVERKYFIKSWWVKDSPPQRQPLTEDEISEIAMDCSFVSESDTYFARAIEKAHGIWGEVDSEGGEV